MNPDFDEGRPWGLKPTVSLRSEPFGALAYDFETRRLSFLKHPLLVDVVRALEGHPTASAACAAVGVAEGRKAAIVRALGVLAERAMIVERAS
jgi:putative mycofactocin binding protein MftB